MDSLITVRKLKEHGVEVYFEKENIYTLDSKGELLITIMSILAQEESRPISENVTWGMRKRFADGKVSMPYKRFMGNDEEAVRKNLKKSVESNPAWSGLTAVQNGRCMLLPEEQFLYKPNAAWAQRYAYLAQILNAGVESEK